MTEIEKFDYLVIGDPVAHSRSPQMQNAAFEALGMGRKLTGLGAANGMDFYS